MEKVLIALLFAPALLLGTVSCWEKPSYGVFEHPSAEALFNFGYTFLEKLQSVTTHDNIIISPESLYTALTLILPGLSGDTKTHAEIEEALLGGLQLDDDVIDGHVNMNQLVFNTSDVQYKLHQASRVFIDKTIHLSKQYKNATNKQNLLGRNAYKRVDFTTNHEEARQKINRFVEKNTNGEITDFLDSDQVTPLTRMFLITALSLEATWNAKLTKNTEGDFTVTADEVMKVQYMLGEGRCNHYNLYYNKNDKWAVVKVPFKASELTMVMIMPKKVGDFSSLSEQDIKDALAKVAGTYRWPVPCQLNIPKFKIKTDISNAVPVLKQMGITSIFDPSTADLSNMFQKGNTEDISLTDFTHEATIEVDENGVKASAATGAGFAGRSIPQFVSVDKPFLFLIRHEATGSTLFLGKVTKPQN